MMKTKNILAIALLPALTMLTAACSGDNEQQMEGRVPITLTAVPLTVEETRAAANTELNTGYIEVGQTVKVSIRNTNSTGDWADYAYVAASGGVLTPPSTPPYYPLDNTHVDIVAYSPSTASSTFSVLPDQTTNDSYMASDLLFASVTNQEKTASAVPLQFEHKMAKIVVNVTAGNGVSEIQSVRLASIYPQVPFDPATGVVGSATGSQTPITIINNNTTATASGAAVFPAQTVVGNLLTIVTNLGTATYAIDSKTFTAGNVYTISLTVLRTHVNTTTQITGWTEGGILYYHNTGSPFLTFTVGDVSFKMIYVEGGSYSMKYTNTKISDWKIQNEVTVTGTLSDYFIQQTECTNDLYKAVMGSTPSPTNYAGNYYPVQNVAWNDLTTPTTGFLDRLNALVADQLPPGMKFKLPSEAQWQFAAQGGNKRFSPEHNYPYSGTWVVGDGAVYKDNSGTPPCVWWVACKGANELGLYDMSGNVWELCQDNYSIQTSGNKGLDYVDTSSSSYRSIRGGGYGNSEEFMHTSRRGFIEPTGSWSDSGFRLVLQ